MTPQLRFPQFTDEWRVKRLSDIADRVVRRNKENNQNILTISAQQGLVGQEKYFSKIVAAKNVKNYYLLHKNDYAYNKSYSKGYPMGAIKRLIHDEKGVVSTLYICFKLKDRGELFFDQYIEAGKLNSEIEKIAQEGARNHGLLNMSVSDYFTMQVTLPAKLEQEKIAAFLKIIDERIVNQVRKVELLKKYKKGIMQKIFSQQMRFKDENGKFFTDWKTYKAGDLFVNISNRNHEGRLPVLSATQDGGIVRRDSLGRKIDQSDAGVKNYKIIEPDDFVISLRSFQGGIEKSNILGISSPAYTVLRGNEMIVPEFFKHYFKREEFISMLNSTVIGIRDGKQVSYEQFSALKLRLPPVDEQQRTASFLTVLDGKLRAEEALLLVVKQWKKGLLKRMFV